MKKIILFLILFFLSLNISFANSEDNIETLKIKLENGKYKKMVSKLDSFILKIPTYKLVILIKKLEKLDLENEKDIDKKILIKYIKLKSKLELQKKYEFEKEIQRQIKENKILNSYNGKDISSKLTYKSIQKRSLSCEISATADILSYFEGKKISEDNLLGILDKSEYKKLPTKIDGKKYWGNPNDGFVGYIDKLKNGKIATQGYMTGYGVLEKPIEKVFNKYLFKTKIINKYNLNFDKDKTLTEILLELENGNMIQLWGDICTNPKYYSGKENICKYRGKLSWNLERNLNWIYKNKSGKEFGYTGLNGEHAFFLLGYKGNIKNPTHIIVWDTMTGKHTYPKSEWMRKWGKMQYRTIIVYKN